MIRALHELKALTHETRIQLYAMRKVFQRGGATDKIRARFKSRLFLLKTKQYDVANNVRELQNLTAAQTINTKREMGGVIASIRECERMLATPNLALTPPPVPALPSTELDWLDLPAASENESPPDFTLSMEDFLTERPSAEESYDYLDELQIPANDEPEAPHITGPVVEGPSHCPVCADPDPTDRIPCPACGVRYHQDCWEYSGGCAIYGCRAAAPTATP